MAKDKKAHKTLNEPVKKSKLITSPNAINEGQKNLFRALASPDNHIVFINGIAGTGKSFCAASWGLEQLLKGKFNKLVITRPIVEAGEKLGYLPGSAEEKLSPYMLPILDIFGESLDLQTIKELFTEGKIVTYPLAFMRGITFKHSFVLLDEGQNSTLKQMHLFLTRIGQGSKVVITGDTAQSDLGPQNGFADAITRLDGVEGLEVVQLDPNSVVRHGIIPSINSRYEKVLERKSPNLGSI